MPCLALSPGPEGLSPRSHTQAPTQPDCGLLEELSPLTQALSSAVEGQLPHDFVFLGTGECEA